MCQHESSQCTYSHSKQVKGEEKPDNKKHKQDETGQQCRWREVRHVYRMTMHKAKSCHKQILSKIPFASPAPMFGF